jgi:hypothetical protein
MSVKIQIKAKSGLPRPTKAKSVGLAIAPSIILVGNDILRKGGYIFLKTKNYRKCKFIDGGSPYSITPCLL